MTRFIAGFASGMVVTGLFFFFLFGEQALAGVI